MPRTKQFAVEDVLAKAVRRFSTHGYHATSIRDLEQCMGIHRASIYATSGSKRGLLVSALRSHIERYEAALREIVDQSPAAAPALRGMFAGAANDCGFIVRTAVELAAHDDEIERILAEAYSATEHLFSTLIEQGQRAGEIAAGVDPGPVARARLVLCLGSPTTTAPRH